MRAFASLSPYEQKVVNQYLESRQRAEIRAVIERADLERLALTFGEEEISLASSTLRILSKTDEVSGKLEWWVFILPRKGVR